MLVLESTSIFANNIYVSTSGNDTNSGTFTAPFHTLQKGFSAARPGDTVIIRGGTYPVTSHVTTVNSGLPGKWITYKGFPGEDVWIDASNFVHDTAGRKVTGDRQAVLQIQGVSYSRFIGIGVKNSHTVGIIVNGPNTSNIEVIRCKSQGSFGSGISVWYADSVRVLECEITGANDPFWKLDGVRMGREAPHEALSICGATYFEVAYNHVHDCVKEGIDCKEVSAHGAIHHNYIHHLPRQGLYVDCWFGLLEDVDLHSNIVHDCEIGAAISGEGRGASMRNIRFHHNILYNNRASGFVFGIWGSNVNRSDIYVYNNTIVKNGGPNHWHGPAGGIDVRSSSLCDVFIYNNICAYNYAYEIATFDGNTNTTGVLDRQNIVIENNLIAEFKDLKDKAGIYNKVYAYSGRNAICGDPMFTGPLQGNFNLKEGSPAINKGWKDAPFFENDLGALPYVVAPK